jgi:hypothetical protein
MKNAPIFKTALLSLGIIVFCGLILYANQEKLFKLHPTVPHQSDAISYSTLIRNYALVIIGLAGIPFLIRGHLTRSKDLMVKTESETVRVLIDQINESRTELDLLKVEAIIDKNAINQPIKEESKGGVLLTRYLNFNLALKGFDIVNVFHTVDHSLDCMQELNRVYISVCNVHKISRSFHNEDFQSLVGGKIISAFNEEDLRLLYWLATFGEIQRSPKKKKKHGIERLWFWIKKLIFIPQYSNNELLYIEIKSKVDSGMISQQLLTDLDLINSELEKFASY